MDNDEDVTGQTISLTSNITYRIDTNLDKALQGKYRPEMTSLDSFYTTSLMDPGNKVLSSVYTGSFGKTGSQVLIVDRNPILSASPYFWKDGGMWDRTSKNKQGDLIYPLGTYTITVNQNLNKMQELWASATPENRAGVLDASAAVTFIKPPSTPVEASTYNNNISFAPSFCNTYERHNASYRNKGSPEDHILATASLGRPRRSWDGFVMRSPAEEITNLFFPPFYRNTMPIISGDSL